ncbi:hypothetical protein IWX92DRAFT_134891 [Phyllosticta citricarpa]
MSTSESVTKTGACVADGEAHWWVTDRLVLFKRTTTRPSPTRPNALLRRLDNVAAMPPPTDRREILAKLRAQVDEGRPIVGAGAGMLTFNYYSYIFLCQMSLLQVLVVLSRGDSCLTSFS